MFRELLLKYLRKHASHWLILVIDVILVCLSFILAYTIRFNTSLDFDINKLLYQLPFISIIFFISFWLIGTNKGIIRHTDTRDVFNIFLGVTLPTLIITFFIGINNFFQLIPSFTIPKTILLTHYFITIFSLVISRLIFKTLYRTVSSELSNTINTIIYGAGDSGLITYKALNNDTRYNIIGFIDDNKNKIGKKINQINIYSKKDITKSFIEEKEITEIVISIQNIEPEKLLLLTDTLLELGIKVKIVPPLSSWINGGLDSKQIKEVKIEDLLDRTTISLDNKIIKKDINEKTIIVTGAAGSIGSEISRQISNYNYKQLILIDQAESPLYELQQELIRKGIKNFTVIVSDVKDIVKMEQIFSKYKPNKIYHVAAYKHVPLMEENPYEAIQTNIKGTKNIADLSIKYKAERFVMVSTDKAVNPTNVMGATKRIAEMYVSCLSKRSTFTKFTTTRFGNVLGSNGSVIPLFKKQIENGGPLTVTHKDITRFFMTIPEACQLVLEAGTMGDGGEIYIFDMGKSVKIFDIAKRMIHLSGLKYPDDIDIEITGLRPGEKLYEELLADGENTTPTYNEKIMIAKTQEIDEKEVKLKIENLCKENESHNYEYSVKLMKGIVPEYISNNSTYESLDK
ncbi:MAG: polysaccharide biosynthesis protein [Tenacibaculum sp.]|nr:polysaccharide biosynthesis protein [Tenacibaculum sp.]